MRTIRWLIFGVCAALAAMAPAAKAQYPGNPPVNSFYIGNGTGVPPSWQTLLQTQGVLGLGDMASQNHNAVNITGGTITGMPNPFNPSDVANKTYVDNAVTGFTPHTEARLATTAALPANVYNNGTAGVGATLTATASGALSVDATVTLPGDRIVVKNEAAPANNGIYTVTTVGTGGTPYVLTRATDANSPGTGDVNKLGAGTFAFVSAGAINNNRGWVVSSTVTAIGTSAVNWVQFNGGAASGVATLNGLTGNLTVWPSVSGGAVGTSVRLAGIQPQGRLTLQSGAPVMTATQQNKSVLFYDCFHGSSLVPVFNGSIDVLLPVAGCEISNALQASGAGVVNSANVFDEWAVNAGGALTLCTATNGSGGGWAGDTSGSNTARGTGYSALDQTTRGFITNKNTLSNCYTGATNRGPIAANQATLLGTFYSTAAGQTSWRFGAGTTNALIPAVLGIWNAYNRVTVASNYNYRDDTASFATSTIGFFQWAGMSIQVVDGLGEESIRVDAKIALTGGSGVACYMGISQDSQFGNTQVYDVNVNSEGSAGQSLGYLLKTELGTPQTGLHGYYMTFFVSSSVGAICTYQPNSPDYAGIQATARM